MLPDRRWPAVVGDPLAYNRVLAVVGRYSLADARPRPTIGLHRLVQAVIRARLDPAGTGMVADRAVALLRAAFPNDSWETTTLAGL